MVRLPMKIDRVTLTHARIPLVEPFRISNGEIAEKDGIIVAVAGDGLIGVGESSPMAGNFYSGDTPESCWRELTELLIPRALARREWNSLEEACAWIDAEPRGEQLRQGGIRNRALGFGSTASRHALVAIARRCKE